MVCVSVNTGCETWGRVGEEKRRVSLKTAAIDHNRPCCPVARSLRIPCWHACYDCHDSTASEALLLTVPCEVELAGVTVMVTVKVRLCLR